MSSRTVYTSTIRVPVYAGWRCEKCGETNFSTGIIKYAAEASSSSWRSSKQNEAKESASRAAQNKWKYHAYQIISDPNHNATVMRNDFILQSSRCTRCGAKPKWDRDSKYLLLPGLCIMPAIISGIYLITEGCSWGALLVFLISLGGLIYGFGTEKKYRRMMENLPKQYTPVIGSLNEELVEYVHSLKKPILTPDEIIEMVSNYEANTASVNIASQTSLQKTCRACGASIEENRRFCHKCGNEIIG